MDYRKFLSRTEQLVLPYFGGARVEAKDRRFRVRGDGEPGWWRFEIEGRRAAFIERADPEDLSELPSVRGHYAGGWLFSSGEHIERIAIAPAEEPEPLVPCTGRHWYGGELLFDSVEFEDEAEDGARRALEQRQSIADIKGVKPSLRAAFGYALTAAVARETQIPVSPREAAPHVLEISAGGRDAAEQLLRRLERERVEFSELLRERSLIREARRVQPTNVARDPIERCDAALDAAGARMLRARRISGTLIEVAFTFMSERFISMVDPRTLQVHDAGICLSGADREVTLESLPSVIREAIETNQLCITRR